jgi:hypothetical protein
MSQNGGILTKNQLRDSVPRCIVRRCRGVEGWRRARSKRSAPASGEGRGLRGWGFDIPWWSLVPRHPSAKKGLAVVSRGTLSRSAMLRRARCQEGPRPARRKQDAGVEPSEHYALSPAPTPLETRSCRHARSTR